MEDEKFSKEEANDMAYSMGEKATDEDIRNVVEKLSSINRGPVKKKYFLGIVY